MIAKNLTYKILFSRLWTRIIVLVFAIIATIFSLISPYYQKNFIDAILNREQHFIDYSHAMYLMIVAIFFSICAQILLFGIKSLCFYEGSRVQFWISDELYVKTLSLTSKSHSEITNGQIISIFASDILTSSTLIDDILPSFISYLLPIILAPFAIKLILNINILPVFVVTFSILLLNIIMAIYQTKFFILHKKIYATRVGIVNEWLMNIRNIKLLSLIKLFEKKIFKAREDETDNRLKMVTNGSTLNSISYSSPFFINLIGLFFLIKQKNNIITPGEIFSLLWIFGIILTRPMRMLPFMVIMISDCYTSIKRIETFLAMESENESEPIYSNMRFAKKNEIKSALSIKGLNFSIDFKTLLNDINFDVRKGEFLAIVGEVGAGKSILFQALLGFLQCEFKEYKINGIDASAISLKELRKKFSWVSQDLFIMNAKIKDNVSLNYFTEHAYEDKIIHSLEYAQFDLQRENMPCGIDTELGERGVNLSGGQKQRIALARAHYLDRDIILLDDCLSALDVNTEENILKSLLTGEWKTKTRILITHRLSILPYCDRVLIMKNGQLFEGNITPSE